MAGFGKFIETRDHALVTEGVRVTDLAERFGTPLFVLSENTIRHNFRRIHGAFAQAYPAEVIVCAGMKGNWDWPPVASLLRKAAAAMPSAWVS